LGRRDLDPHEILRLEEDRVVLLDQRRLPSEAVELTCRSAAEVAEAIRSMAVRGAPAIGIAAAYGYALAAARGEDLDEAVAVLLASRPTAVNLSWALGEVGCAVDPGSRAREIHEEEVERCRQMGEHAADLLGPSASALTHCNAGGLATGGYGSAVGALRAAFARGILRQVFVDETRPLLQGSRLTAWELERAGIPHTVIADAAAALFMAGGEITHVLTGADRIAANGDTANKIGTYALAVLAAHHAIPFYVVAPDIDTRSRHPDRRRDSHRGARRRGGDAPFSRPQPGLRRHAGEPDHRDRDRGRRPPAALRGLAAPAQGIGSAGGSVTSLSVSWVTAGKGGASSRAVQEDEG
jgi:methylthioribose-1-phosphate isomerase